MLQDIARRPALWVTLLFIALLLGSSFGTGSITDLYRLRTERNSLAKDIFARIRENAHLRRQIHLLQSSDRELERLARRNLGFVRPNEIVYRFRKKDVKKEQ